MCVCGDEEATVSDGDIYCDICIIIDYLIIFYVWASYIIIINFYLYLMVSM